MQQAWKALRYIILAFTAGWAALCSSAAEPELPVLDAEFRRHMEQAAGQPILEGNQITELINGVEYFPAMLDAIRKAERSITFENFIWRSGKVSDQFIEALCERARAGVKVHCIADGFGTLRLRSGDIQKMRKCGVDFRIYNRIRPYNFWMWNHRTHRKTLVVDGKVGFIGGICVADEWDGDGDRQEVWRDTEFKVLGPMVAQIQAAFTTNWHDVRGPKLTGPDYFPPLTNAGSISAHSFVSGLRENRRSAREVHMQGIQHATKTIRIAHSYFVPDHEMVEALRAAAKRGVRIQVITSGHKLNMVRRASRSTFDNLMDVGVDFYEFNPTKYHCKVMIVDDAWVTTGSINFDDRSFHINDEGNINVWDREFAQKQTQVFDADLAQSTHIDPIRFKNRFFMEKWVDNFCGLFRRWL
ncbi:MAG TPA: phospholipase D-like domain-containing protein [Methylomirabilota bacterium]|nr:phospholipase D-like domain-containing protein [Methylomirabilota bacterium]